MKTLFERVLVRCFGWVLNLILRVYGFFLEDPPENTNGIALDPDLQAFLALRGPFDPDWVMETGFERARAISSYGMRVTGPTFVRLPSVEDRVIDGPDTDLPVRVYDPEPSEELPGCVFYHGGGFVLGDLDSHDYFCRLLARDANCRVVAVGYRRAPEHRFPAAVEDAVASFQWTYKRASELNIDPERIAVAGDSAGATLATVVCQHRIKHDRTPPDRQFLFYPMTDQVDDYPSRHQENEQILLPWEGAEWFGEQYVSEEDLDSVEDYRISPLQFQELSKMPPTILASAGFDPLRDENLAYVDRLKENGIEVQHHHYGNLVHGFITFGGLSSSARKATDELIEAIAKAW